MKTSLLGLLLPTLVVAQERDLVTVARTAGGFDILLTAVETAGLTDVLRGAGPFTVFAPTDAAFEALPDGALAGLLRPSNRDRLIAVLRHHVVAGRATAAAGVAAGTVETLDGKNQQIRLRDGRLFVGEAGVVTNDIAASNGIIHVIDRVLLPAAPPSSPQRTVADLLSLAVERGAPLFNAGQMAGCAAIYEVAARAALVSGTLSEAGMRAVERALAAANRDRNDRARSWSLRRGLDLAYRDLTAQLDAETASGAASEETVTTSVDSAPVSNVVFAFDDPDSDPRWFTVNDDVMGGVSKSSYASTDRGTALFRGALSLDNNGGFATIRSPAAALELGGQDGVIVRVRGDGRTYNFSAMPSARRWEMSIWRSELPTVAGEWTEVRIPFDELVRTFRGRRSLGSNTIDPAKIESFSFSISDKNETPFELEIDWIRAYRDGAFGD